MKEAVIVKKDRKSREIKTFVRLDSHGAEMDLDSFIAAIADAYGSPALTMTKKGLAEKLKLAADAVIFEMKSQTTEVAALSVKP